MTWTYSCDPSSSEKDAVRWKVGDTDSDDPIVQDEEIEYELTQFATDPRQIIKASINVAKGIAAKFASESTYRIGQVSETLSRKAEAYERLVSELIDELTMSARRSVVPAMVAHSKSLKAVNEANTDRVQPGVRVGMDDNYGTTDDLDGSSY